MLLGCTLLVLLLNNADSAKNYDPSKYMQTCTSPNLFCNASLSAAARAANLVSLLTLDEKISQLSTNSFTKTYNGLVPGIPRLGIPEYDYHTEGLHGIRDSDVAGFKNSTLFPQVTGMSATGNLSLIYEMARAMAFEMRAVNNVMRERNQVVTRGGGLALYGPTINIIRDGRWGRNQESVSEDPWLSGQYAANFIRGVQGEGEDEDDNYNNNNKFLAVAATCKHLDAYSQETHRHDSNAQVSQLDLMETYLPQFEACVAAGAQQVMCSYNKINNVPACLDGSIQNGIVRDKWNFQGSIVSDCDAIKDVNVTQKTMTGPEVTAAGILNGCDQDCGNFYGLYASDAIKEGLLNDTDVDTALVRILTMRFKLGEFGDMTPWSKVAPNQVGSKQHAALALQAARESITLLRNDKGMLPLLLDDGSVKRRVGLVGPLANSTSVMEGAKQDYRAKHIVSVLEGLETKMSSSSSSSLLTYSPGLSSVTDDDTSSRAYKEAVRIATEADVAIVVVGIDGTVEGEALDRRNVILPGAQEQMIRDIATARASKVKELIKTNNVAATVTAAATNVTAAAATAAATSAAAMIVVLINGGPISCDWLQGETPVPIAVIEAFEGGQSAGTALAETMYGENNPSGVLPFTLYKENSTVEKIVPFTRFDMRPNGTYPGRTYRFSVAPTLWEFGYGLSYTKFVLSWSPSVDGSDDGDGGGNHHHSIHLVHSPGVVHKVRVTNVGKVAGAKVVQAFVTKKHEVVHATLGAPSSPLKELFGMNKVWLEPGETTEVTFNTISLAGSKPFFTVMEDGRSMLIPGRVVITVGVGEERIDREMLMVGDYPLVL